LRSKESDIEEAGTRLHSSKQVVGVERAALLRLMQDRVPAAKKKNEKVLVTPHTELKHGLRTPH
jgi:hypothetical protein